MNISDIRIEVYVYPVPSELKNTFQMFNLRTETCYTQTELNRKLGKPGRIKKNIKMRLSKVDPKQGVAK